MSETTSVVFSAGGGAIFLNARGDNQQIGLKGPFLDIGTDIKILDITAKDQTNFALSMPAGVNLAFLSGSYEKGKDKFDFSLFTQSLSAGLNLKFGITPAFFFNFGAALNLSFSELVLDRSQSLKNFDWKLGPNLLPGIGLWVTENFGALVSAKVFWNHATLNQIPGKGLMLSLALLVRP